MVNKFAAAVIFVLGCALTGPAACLAQRSEMETRPDSVQFGLALMKDQADAQFVPVDYAKLPPLIRAQAENHLAFYLTPEAQPQNDPEFKTRVFSASGESQDDLVEYRWKFEGLPLRAVQSLNAFKLEVPLDARLRIDDVKLLVESIVKLKGTDLSDRDYEVKLRWPASLSEGVQFSSNPDANLLRLNSWHERVDAVVEGGRLAVLIYKKVPQLMIYQDGSKWFEKYPPPATKPATKQPTQ